MKLEDSPTMIRYLFKSGKGELGQVLRDLRVMLFMAVLSGLSTVGVFVIAVFGISMAVYLIIRYIKEKLK